MQPDHRSFKLALVGVPLGPMLAGCNGSRVKVSRLQCVSLICSDAHLLIHSVDYVRCIVGAGSGVAPTKDLV